MLACKTADAQNFLVLLIAISLYANSDSQIWLHNTFHLLESQMRLQSKCNIRTNNTNNEISFFSTSVCVSFSFSAYILETEK